MSEVSPHSESKEVSQAAASPDSAAPLPPRWSPTPVLGRRSARSRLVFGRRWCVGHGSEPLMWTLLEMCRPRDCWSLVAVCVCDRVSHVHKGTRKQKRHLGDGTTTVVPDGGET
ncbi:hypothetical protein E2C01_061522 [Portunus trituberculatus]|uniref:Uncharacterized protein n=1 Tax=Portunus trituberculatus TaxID=210409 RepID=A0A5B7HDE6_PORTR|nr:hypothetical protein [Portunus trituberculatus]